MLMSSRNFTRPDSPQPLEKNEPVGARLARDKAGCDRPNICGALIAGKPRSHRKMRSSCRSELARDGVGSAEDFLAGKHRISHIESISVQSVVNNASLVDRRLP